MALELQKGIAPQTGEVVWVMLDSNYQVFEPVQRYLTSLCGSKSPKTVETYGYALKVWFEFLESKDLDWQKIQLENLEDFVYWLRVGDTSKVVSMQQVLAQRSEKTINLAITVVTNFYKYHMAAKTIDYQQCDRLVAEPIKGKKGLLEGIGKSKPMREKLVKVKEPKNFTGCLTPEEIETLVNACNRLRDKLIILTLNSTGMRVGELLGVCHDDIGDFDNYTIKVVKRSNNPNGARAKGAERVIPVPKELLEMYNDYLIHEYPEVESDFVFVNIWEGNVGQPMNPKVLNTMFSRLSKKTGIEVYPHLFRHTYATRLLKANYPLDRVKYLLGHQAIKTTLDVYSHLTGDEPDLRVVVEQSEGEE